MLSKSTCVSPSLAMQRYAPQPPSRSKSTSAPLGTVDHFTQAVPQIKRNHATSWLAALALLLVVGACIPMPCVSVCEIAPNAVTGFVTDQNFAPGYTTVNSSAFEQCYSLVSITFPITLSMISANAFNSATFLTTVCGNIFARPRHCETYLRALVTAILLDRLQLTSTMMTDVHRY